MQLLSSPLRYIVLNLWVEVTRIYLYLSGLWRYDYTHFHRINQSKIWEELWWCSENTILSIGYHALGKMDCVQMNEKRHSWKWWQSSFTAELHTPLENCILVFYVNFIIFTGAFFPSVWLVFIMYWIHTTVRSWMGVIFRVNKVLDKAEYWEKQILNILSWTLQMLECAFLTFAPAERG